MIFTHRLFQSSLVFGLVASFSKALIFPTPLWNPPFIFPMLTAFIAAAFFWWWLILRNGKTTLTLGFTAGGLVGLITPPLMWLPYGLFLAFTLERGWEPLRWSPIYAWLMLRSVSPFSFLLGGIVGVVLISLHRKSLSTNSRNRKSYEV